MEWTVDGLTVFGPVSIDQLRHAVTVGQVPITAHARQRGILSWTSLGELLHGHESPGDSGQSGQPPSSLPPVLSRQASPQSIPLQVMPSATLQSPPLAQLQKEVEQVEATIVARRKELESVEEAIEIQAFGFYRPRYGLESSEKYAEELKSIREQQKGMVKEGTATACGTNWVIGGSSAEGKKMVDRMSKLMLRAFNAECDSAIGKAKYDNVLNLEQRINKSFSEITKLGESNRIAITKPYLDLKLAELHLVHEHREKVQQEKEEQRHAKEQLRDDLKAQEEIDRARTEAEEDETRYQKALEKARVDLMAAQGRKAEAQTEKLEMLVSRLEVELKDTLERKAKAIARAQLTKSGHVYLISNIGSFGPDVYKIGLTRRFEPLERIEELGNASVPFPFDVHAIIYSEDAPALEAVLHQEFSSRRVNMVNGRKEYFRVSMEEVRAAVEKHFGLVTFVLTPEAEQWRKTQALMAEFQADASRPNDHAMSG
jgi:Domain of unknown function (DUF4041)/Meiotically up-regulated gene 113